VTAPAPRGLSGALTRFRVMAYFTGVLLAFMTVVGLPYKYLLDGDAAWYGLGWMLHGWAYIAYVAVALDLVFRLRWGLLRALGVVLAGTIPFMSFVAERKVTHAVQALTDPATPQVVDEVPQRST
jgi:integral membrane protein